MLPTWWISSSWMPSHALRKPEVINVKVEAPLEMFERRSTASELGTHLRGRILTTKLWTLAYKTPNARTHPQQKKKSKSKINEDFHNCEE